MSQPWILKYAPARAADIPQQDPVTLLGKYIDTYDKQKKKAALLYGPAGSCKTCAVHALAAEKGLEVVEVNASDARNKAQIEARVGEALKQRSLFSSGKIILIDEADGLSGTKDRGGLTTLLKIIINSAFPVVITCNNAFDQKFSSLRKKSLMIEFPALNSSHVLGVLRHICERESVAAEESALVGLAHRCGGDLRSAINDLQCLSHDKILPQSRLDSLGDRDKIEGIKDALVRVFKTTDASIALKAFDNVLESMDKCSLWIDENLPREYKGIDLARAYRMLSKADVYRGRIRRRQHWRFLVHINTLQTAGVAVAKDARSSGIARYEQPSRILQLWIAKQKWLKRRSIAEKLAPHVHCSARGTVQAYMPFLPALVKADPAFGERLVDRAHLDDAEIKWLKK